MEQNQSFRGNHRGGFRGGGFRGNNRGGGFRGNNRGGFRGGRGRGGFRQNHEDVDYSPEAIERRFARFYLPSMSQDPWAQLEQKYKK